jgi:hypothetical protein
VKSLQDILVIHQSNFKSVMAKSELSPSDMEKLRKAYLVLKIVEKTKKLRSHLPTGESLYESEFAQVRTEGEKLLRTISQNAGSRKYRPIAPLVQRLHCVMEIDPTYKYELSETYTKAIDWLSDHFEKNIAILDSRMKEPLSREFMLVAEEMGYLQDARELDTYLNRKVLLVDSYRRFLEHLKGQMTKIYGSLRTGLEDLQVERERLEGEDPIVLSPRASLEDDKLIALHHSITSEGYFFPVSNVLPMVLK